MQSSQSITLDRWYRWTPEEILARGLGPLDVARILVAEGWTIEQGSGKYDFAVVATRGRARRDLWDPATSTRKREAKCLSEALGGVYSYTVEDAPVPPCEWPDEWDFERHRLARLFEMSAEERARVLSGPVG